MSEQSYSKNFIVSVNAEAVHKAITKQIDKWWTVSTNEAFNISDILTVRFGKTYFISMEIVNIIPNKLLVWKVVDANMFIEGGSTNNDEWVGTEIQWKIKETKNGCEVTLYHEGLVPSFECYNTCYNGWEYYLESLKDFLETGKGDPYSEVRSI
jgi:hypothetical protein